MLDPMKASGLEAADAAVSCLPLPATKPFLKWPGGKESELAFLLPFFPGDIDRYFEPFLGGGAAYFAARAQGYVVNDRSDDLMALYGCIQRDDADFFATLQALSDLWDGTKQTVSLTAEQLQAAAAQPVQLLGYLQRPVTGALARHGFPELEDDAAYAAAVAAGLKRKLRTVLEGNDAAGADMALQTAMKAALYTLVRQSYNRARAAARFDAARAVAFFFLREFCYSSMFRFSSKGEFNVPYGGFSYGRKSMASKMAQMRSPAVQARFARTSFHCSDFAQMLQAEPPGERDFIFVDPPYDSMFSTYDNNAFEGSDQARLAQALKATKARFMLVVKNTPLMQALYADCGLHLLTYDMQYSVSFMNRNDRDVEHLMVLNYEPPAHLLQHPSRSARAA